MITFLVACGLFMDLEYQLIKEELKAVLDITDLKITELFDEYPLCDPKTIIAARFTIHMAALQLLEIIEKKMR